MILVDSCVLLDVLGGDPVWAVWSQSQLDDLEQARSRSDQSSHVRGTRARISTSPSALGKRDSRQIGLEYRGDAEAALFLAGKAHQTYRRRGGEKPGVLSDFFIGAHAAVLGVPLLTRDARRFRRYFPSVLLLTP